MLLRMPDSPLDDRTSPSSSRRVSSTLSTRLLFSTFDQIELIAWTFFFFFSRQRHQASLGLLWSPYSLPEGNVSSGSSTFSFSSSSCSTRTDADGFLPLLLSHRFAGVNIKKVTPSSQNATGAFDAAVTTLAGKDAKVASMWTQSLAYVGNNSVAWVSSHLFLPLEIQTEQELTRP